jgi:hypothetical protein
MNNTQRASLFEEWRQIHYLHKRNFESHVTSYIDALLPEIAVQLNVFEIFAILQKRLGDETLTKAFNPTETIGSPFQTQKNGDWLKQSNIVGINVRTVGNFFNVVKYMLTLPSFHDSIHLLPIWEPGVVASLYGKTSFVINEEFYSEEWAKAVPALDTAQKQLKALVNVAHAMGKAVGMDVIPHADRFAEMVFTHPRNFEWVKRVGGKMISHGSTLYQDVEGIIWSFLHRRGTANGTPISYSRSIFFNPSIPILSDNQRSEILFGYENDYETRLYRRLDLMNELVAQGFETLPMTMAPPYRGLHIDGESFSYDNNGNRWFDYKFNEPQSMSRVFGPLTRYKFFETQKDSWELDFSNPNKSAWDFLGEQYLATQQAYNFDFMRGDMAHVQPRSEGVPEKEVEYYDPLLSVKQRITDKVPYFAFYAETFLAPPDIMGYGNEIDHLEKIEAEATLGDLQSTAVGSPEFLTKFLEYIAIGESRTFTPTLTIMTGDKDDPRFDPFFRFGNILRYFTGIFYTSLPSYYSLGFETRGQNLSRNLNETYSKLYVFKISDEAETDKFTDGPFVWGNNEEQFREILQLRKIGDDILGEIKTLKSYILQYPNIDDGTFIWTQYPDLRYVFVANILPDKEIDEEIVTQHLSKYTCELIYQASQHGKHECRIYKILK